MLAALPEILALATGDVVENVPPVFVGVPGEPVYLDWALCDLNGREIQPLVDRDPGGSVTITLDGKRTVAVTISDEEEAARYLAPLKTVLKVWLNDAIIFAGIVTKPSYSGSTGKVTINAVNPIRRLERVNLRAPYNPGTRAQGLIIHDLVLLAQGVIPAGVPGIGMSLGLMENGVERHREEYPVGQNVWSAITDLTGLLDGPDIYVEPLDRTDGILGELRVLNRVGTDRSSDVFFEFNTLRHNCVDFTYDPDGDLVINHAAIQGQSPDGASTPPIEYVGSLENQKEVGIWEHFETMSDVKDAAELPFLRKRGEQLVEGYGEPPPFFTITPAYEGIGEQFGVPPLVIQDYGIGDTVTGIAELGKRSVWEKGRVESIKITEIDKAGNVKTETGVRPEVPAAGLS